MQTITITGGQTLHGTIRPAAAKNSVLPLLAATLLCGAPCCLRNAPELSDVDTSLALLAAVGAALAMSGAVMQCVLHNPLASASTLGVSQGAAFGACWAILAGGTSLAISGSAFAVSLAAVGIVLLVLMAGIVR